MTLIRKARIDRGEAEARGHRRELVEGEQLSSAEFVLVIA
jgi:hypothetical protein